MTSIGDRVREQRLAKGLTQQALSGDGISPGYVSLIESGKRIPSPTTLRRLARRLGVGEEVLTGEAPTPSGASARVEANFARLALANGNPAEAVRSLGAVAFEELDGSTAADATLVLAESLQQTGQLDRAVDVLETLIARARAERAWLTLATAAAVLAVMYIESGDTSRSVETAEAALDQIAGAGIEGTDEYLRLGSVFVSSLIERGDLVFATRRVAELVEIADRVGSARARGSVYWNAAVVAHGRGRIADAVRLTDRAVALLGEQEQSRDLPRLRLHYAWLLLSRPLPDPTGALEQLDRAESDPMMAGSQLDLGTACTFRGRAHLLRGELDDAAENAARALELLGPSEHVERVSALLLLGDVGTFRDDPDLANEALGEAERVLSRMEASRRSAHLWRELGDAWRDLGEVARAMSAYERSFLLVGLMPRAAPARTHDEASSTGLSTRTS